MTPREARGARTRGGVSEPLNLIHTNNCSNPVLARPAARLTPELTALIRVHYDAIVQLVPAGHFCRLQIGAWDGS